MDRQATLGFILIGLVMLVWMWFQTPAPQPPRPATHDSVGVKVQEAPPVQHPVTPPAHVEDSAQARPDLGKFFAKRSAGAEKILVVETDLYRAEISSHGGVIRSWALKHYLTWDKSPVEMVMPGKGGDFGLLFTSADGRLVNTRDLFFDAGYINGWTVTLKGDESFSAVLTLPTENGGTLVKTLKFTNGSYAVDAGLQFTNLSQVISNYEYQVVWEHGLPNAEYNSVDESSFAMAYASSGGELAELDAPKGGETKKSDLNGSTDWVAARNKYFAVALLPEPGKSQGAYVEGRAEPRPNNGIQETYSLALKMPLKGAATETATISLYLGPLDYDIIKSYGRGLTGMMNLGAAWIIRPISEYVMIPLFKFLRMFIPNYGIIIIVFSIIIKIALTPLTRSSMRSMRKMQALTPMMNEIREKYKDDPQKMNAQVMNLYKEYGVNPASGCLPLVLQMPILFALYAVFRSSIELRQAHFAWWITDLSIPDVIVHLPITIPFFGITALSGVALAMGVTMFVQQKMSVTDPRQKAMIYMMPILMTLLFNGFPSGLNLYYFVFNVLSIGQQMFFNRQHAEDPLRKVEPKKKPGGFMSKITKDLPKLK
jgi:YidC/Oxa1 family membrane protein insertase